MAELTYVGGELDLFAQAHNWKSYIASLLRPWIRGTVLEVGAGIGATTRALLNDSVTSWTCLEPDPALVARLTESVESIRPGIRIVNGSLDDIDAEIVFDTILYVDVLEHIEDDSAELRLAARHLAPGGALVVLAPAFQLLYSDFDRALGHHRRYTTRSLARVFPPGLEKRDLFYADSLGAALSLANRVILRQESPAARQIRFWDRVVIPASRITDNVARHFLGRSVIGIYSRPVH